MSLYPGVKFVLAILCGIATLACSLAAPQADEDGRIIGGQVIDVSKAPYIVQLRYWSGELMCGGSIISETHVLSAAHCFDFTPYTDVVVVAGVTATAEEGEKRNIDWIHKPESYTRASMETDVVVIKLSSPLHMSKKIQKIDLCSKRWKVDDSLQVSGWGRTTEHGPISTHLRTISLRTISHGECVRLNSGLKTPVSQSSECAYLPNKDSCQYDSGGPGVINRELCAIVSWGYGCAYRNYPGVYTSVYAMRPFIENALNY